MNTDGRGLPLQDESSAVPAAATEVLSTLGHGLIDGRQHRLNEATKELLQIPGFLESFARGTKDVRAGRVKPWRKIRRDV